MKLECIEQPMQEPVAVDEIKDYLRIDDDNEDVLLTSLITAARGYCEDYQKQASCIQKLQLTLSNKEVSGAIELPRSRYLREVNEVVCIAGDDTKTEIPFVVRCGNINSLLYVENYLLPDGDLVITYTVGAEKHDPQFVMAIKMLVAGLYENRLPFSEGKILSEVPFGVKALLQGGRVLL